MLHHQQDAFDQFEEISALVKQTHLKFTDPKHDFEVNAQHGNNNRSARDEWISRSKNLLNEVNDLLDSSDKALLSTAPVAMPNWQEMAEMLEWAGYGFGDEFNHQLGYSMKRLGQMSGASALSFFGKIYGTQQDYIICSGKLDSNDKSKDSKVEAAGDGTNTITFWVTDNLLNDWIQLPETRPEHIEVARCIKHVFTGHLGAEIDSNPPFPGKERHLLKAQLVRISHATAICPKDTFMIDEDTNKM